MLQIRWQLQHLLGLNKLIILVIETSKNKKRNHLTSVVSEEKMGKSMAFDQEKKMR